MEYCRIVFHDLTPTKIADAVAGTNKHTRMLYELRTLLLSYNPATPVRPEILEFRMGYRRSSHKKSPHQLLLTWNDFGS
jgi:hypothetical protein